MSLPETQVRVALPFGKSTPPEKRICYQDSLAAHGIEFVISPPSLDGLSGLMLAGGADVEPSLYGEARDPRTEPADSERDTLEIALLQEALSRDLPVFGICRGHQLLNAALGGSLTQHVEGHNQRKVRDAHPVEIAPESRLSRILWPGTYSVNSRHHQCVGRVAPGLVATAVSRDGIVEALEIPGKRFVLTVQWHPEARPDGPDARLFAAFRAALR